MGEADAKAIVAKVVNLFPRRDWAMLANPNDYVSRHRSAVQADPAIAAASTFATRSTEPEQTTIIRLGGPGSYAGQDIRATAH